jgi:sodium transport system permease protein
MKLNATTSLLVYLAALVYTYFAGFFLTPLAGVWAGPFFSAGFVVIPLIAAIFFRLDVRDSFRLKRPGLRQTAGGLVLSSGLFLLVLLASVFLAVFFPDLPVSGKAPGTNALDKNIFRVVISIVVMPALCEEFLFRGFILSGLTRTLTKWKSIILCALLFAFIHPEPLQLPFAFVVGLGLSWVALETNTLWIPVLMHAFHNASLLLVVRVMASSGFALSSLADFTKPSQLFFIGICSFGGLLVSAILVRLGIGIVARSSRSFPAAEKPV